MSWKIIIIAFTTQFGFNSDLQILLIVATLVNDNYIRIQFEMHLVLLKVDNCDVYRRPARTVRMVIDSFRSARSCNGLQSAVILKMELCSATYQHLRNRTNLPSIHHNSIMSRSAISLYNVRFIQCAEIWYMIYRLLENRIWTEGIFPAIFAKWYIGKCENDAQWWSEVSRKNHLQRLPWSCHRATRLSAAAGYNRQSYVPISGCRIEQEVQGWSEFFAAIPGVMVLMVQIFPVIWNMMKYIQHKFSHKRITK